MLRENKMKRSLVLALSLIFASGTAAAEERLINDDVEKALAQSSEQMNKSVEQMNAAFEKVMPELARSMAPAWKAPLVVVNR